MNTNSDTTPKLYVGLDVHKEQTSVAIADPGRHGEVRSHGSIATYQPSIEKHLRRKWGHKWGRFRIERGRERGRVTHFNNWKELVRR